MVVGGRRPDSGLTDSLLSVPPLFLENPPKPGGRKDVSALSYNIHVRIYHSFVDTALGPITSNNNYHSIVKNTLNTFIITLLQ
jgi:hypothetical protein